MLAWLSTHLYLMLSLYFLAIAVGLFLWRKDYRTEMLITGAAGALFAPVVQYMHLQDWWSPTFLGNQTGFFKLEDIVFGIAVASLGAVLGQLVLGVRLRPSRKAYVPTLGTSATGVLLAATILLAPFFFLGWHSATTTNLACLAMLGFVAWRRPNLIPMALASGITLTILAIPAYLAALTINPHWFSQHWFLHNLSGTYIGPFPIEELVWYAIIGTTFSPLWKCATGLTPTPRITRLPRRMVILNPAVQPVRIHP